MSFQLSSDPQEAEKQPEDHDAMVIDSAEPSLHIPESTEPDMSNIKLIQEQIVSADSGEASVVPERNEIPPTLVNPIDEEVAVPTKEVEPSPKAANTEIAIAAANSEETAEHVMAVDLPEAEAEVEIEKRPSEPSAAEPPHPEVASTPSTPPPAQIQVQSSTMTSSPAPQAWPQNGPENPPEAILASEAAATEVDLPLPRLLNATPGKSTPDVSEVVFEVDDELAAAARRWADRHTKYECVVICNPFE